MSGHDIDILIMDWRVVANVKWNVRTSAERAKSKAGLDLKIPLNKKEGLSRHWCRTPTSSNGRAQGSGRANPGRLDERA